MRNKCFLRLKLEKKLQRQCTLKSFSHALSSALFQSLSRRFGSATVWEAFYSCLFQRFLKNHAERNL